MVARVFVVAFCSCSLAWFAATPSVSFGQVIVEKGLRAIFAPPAVEAAADVAEATTPEDAAKLEAAAKEAAAKEAAEEAIEIERPAEALPPRHVRMHLRDGSMLAGDLTVDKIELDTEFGRLTIPVDRIVSFKPGLESSPERLAEIDGLVEKLGSDDFNTREQAQKDLTRLGLPARRELEQRLAGTSEENAERRTRLAQILKDFEQQSEEQDEGESQAEPWVRGDTVVTSEFTVVGKIVDQQFKIVSKYGALDVNLGDLLLADRPGGVKASIRRTVAVSGTNLAQTNFKTTGLRVERGDKITVRASGTIAMTPWGGGQQSTPDGGSYYGWYRPNEIEGGALVAKIGDSGQIFKVGSKKTFIAKQSGVLQFAMGMQDQYSQQGYSFPGEYSVKITVEPK